jgi:hypothetical protein
MGLSDQKASPAQDVPRMMEPRRNPGIPVHTEVIDGATLYLCRQGRRWVVVIESPRTTGAVPFSYAGHDSHEARLELLTTVRRACPDATVMTTDGALNSEDYEWRVELRGVAVCAGDLGVAVHGELSMEPGGDAGARRPVSRRPVIGRRCHWGLSPAFSGRPRTF